MTAVPIHSLFTQAARLESLGRSDQAIDLYKNWMALNPNDGLLHGAYFNYAVALSRVGDRSGAINALRECIRIKPDFHPPYINLGRQLEDGGQNGHAVAIWLELVNLLAAVNGGSVRSKLMVLQQLGRVLEGLHRDGPAEDALRQSLDISVNQPEVVQHWIALRQRQCKWPVIEAWDGVTARALLRNISPLSAAVMLDDPLFQLARNARYARDTILLPMADQVHKHDRRVRRRGDRLKIGYVSSDLREHAVGFGLAELFELHDRERFEIHAYYCGIEREDPTKSRIRNAVSSWTDITRLDDPAAASRIAEDGIDILIDVNGYTRDARTAIFARRPAPIAVNWFGFPGTMGTPYHHYLIGDEFVVPPGDEIFYSERVVRLPCYQPNDRRRTVAVGTESREREGLPQDAFVFCCLNGTQKITAEVFACWMSILRTVPGSVLWLLESYGETMQTVRNLAEAEGIDPARLVFAPKRPNPEHLARYRLADLFLDTSPYGAHTTAADAIWMGVPILTVPGSSFASRVCGGLLHAAGVPELVCGSPSEFEQRAIDLSSNPEANGALRRKLEANRLTSRLFDTLSLARDLEALFASMWQDFEEGRLPRPDLRNLDAYLDVGLDIHSSPPTVKGGDNLIKLYRARLTALDKIYPLDPDHRLWPIESDCQ